MERYLRYSDSERSLHSLEQTLNETVLAPQKISYRSLEDPFSEPLQSYRNSECMLGFRTLNKELRKKRLTGTLETVASEILEPKT